jgi:IS66 Orf2 like protein
MRVPGSVGKGWGVQQKEWINEARLRRLVVSSKDPAHLKTVATMLHANGIQTEEVLRRLWRSASFESLVILSRKHQYDRYQLTQNGWARVTAEVEPLPEDGRRPKFASGAESGLGLRLWLCSGRGVGSWTACSQVAIGCREATDRRADVTAGRERGFGGYGTRSEREPVFKWRRPFERGEVSEPGVASTGLIPVAVCAGCDSAASSSDAYERPTPPAFIHIEFPGRALISIESGVDPTVALDPGELAQVIELRTGSKIWIAAGLTDLRRGFQGLSVQVQRALELQPFSGHAFVFRGVQVTRLNFFSSMETAYAIRLQKTHELSFEPRQVMARPF